MVDGSTVKKSNKKSYGVSIRELYPKRSHQKRLKYDSTAAMVTM